MMFVLCSGPNQKCSDNFSIHLYLSVYFLSDAPCPPQPLTYETIIVVRSGGWIVKSLIIFSIWMSLIKILSPFRYCWLKRRVINFQSADVCTTPEDVVHSPKRIDVITGNWKKKYSVIDDFVTMQICLFLLKFFYGQDS